MSLPWSKHVEASNFQDTNRRKSLGLLALGILIVQGMWSATSFAEEAKPAGTTLVDEKYSLKADREALEALRKQIPPEVKKENDEKAFMDQMMSDLSRSPSEVRGKFSSILNKKRDLFNKDMTKSREQFSKAQKEDREAFSKEQAEQRKSFSKRKASSEDRKEFFDELEAKRKDFYSNQKEKRDEFEAETRDKRKNFDDYVRAKTDEFNQLHRDYTKRFEENKKSQADIKKQAELKRQQMQKDLDHEYEPIRKKDPTVLEPNSTEQ
ncbi:hypothetical protein [Bdellovibrio sp.]|uniref:hypothetical protein n=1 Tax=Bdellovibrio sp. TaxID=28201 RepID=UPI0039E63703